mmetsp:Transcript_63420/g.151568  ORF Transcript_63420/g.151568 Transcript_63420/m.151568 type:complete len:388 (+) Transcript_63420:1770-2933(+)
MGLDERVVADDIGHAVLLHLLHPCLSLLQLRAFHAGIQDSVVNDAVEFSSAALQGLKDVHRSLQVLLHGTAANHRDVLGNIQRIVGEERLCQLAAPALQGGVHDAPLHAGVQDGSAFSRSLLAQRGGILLVHVADSVVVLDLEVEAKESSQDCRRHALREVLVRLVRESKISRLLAACQQCQAQLGSCIWLLGDGLLEKLLDFVVVISVSLHQQAVGRLGKCDVLLARKRFNLLQELWILLSHGFCDHSLNGILRQRHCRKLGEKQLQLMLLASHVDEVANDLTWGGGGSRRSRACPKGLELAEGAQGILEVLCLQRRLDQHDGGARGQRDLGGLGLRDQQIHHLEVAHREVHVYEDLVAAAVQHKACRGQRDKEPLDEVRIVTLSQ